MLEAHPPAAAFTCCTTAILNTHYPSNWYSGDWSYDNPQKTTFTVRCNYVGGVYPTTGSCWLWKLQYGNYQVASGCEPSKIKPVFQQTETLCFNDGVSGPATLQLCCCIVCAFLSLCSLLHV